MRSASSGLPSRGRPCAVTAIRPPATWRTRTPPAARAATDPSGRSPHQPAAPVRATTRFASDATAASFARRWPREGAAQRRRAAGRVLAAQSRRAQREPGLLHVMAGREPGQHRLRGGIGEGGQGEREGEGDCVVVGREPPRPLKPAPRAGRIARRQQRLAALERILCRLARDLSLGARARPIAHSASRGLGAGKLRIGKLGVGKLGVGELGVGERRLGRRQRVEIGPCLGDAARQRALEPQPRLRRVGVPARPRAR